MPELKYLVFSTATHLQIGPSNTEQGRGGQAVAVDGEDEQQTVTGTFVCIAHLQWCVILTLHLESFSAPRVGNRRIVRKLGIGEM